MHTFNTYMHGGAFKLSIDVIDSFQWEPGHKAGSQISSLRTTCSNWIIDSNHLSPRWPREPEQSPEPSPDEAWEVCAANIYFRNTSSAPKWGAKRQSGVQRRLGSLPRSLRLLGTKVTGPNLTRRDGNLSDTPNNLLMQKLKGLSVSLGGGEGRTGACIMEMTSERRRPVRFQRPLNCRGVRTFLFFYLKCTMILGCNGLDIFFFFFYNVFVRETGSENNKTFRLTYSVNSRLSVLEVRREVEDHN